MIFFSRQECTFEFHHKMTNMMTLIQAYEAMGIQDPPALTKQVLKARYRDLVLQVHPDRGGNAYLFDLIKQAYHTICQSRKDWNDYQSVTDGMTQLQVDRAEYEQNVQRQHLAAPAHAAYAAHPAHPAHPAHAAQRPRVSQRHMQPQHQQPQHQQQHHQPQHQQSQLHVRDARSRPIQMSAQQFDVAQFNSLFDEHREPTDEEAKHHASFMRSNDRVVRDVVVYQEPDALVSTRHNFASLDAHTDSFTGRSYTDLYEAYTERHPDEIQGRAETYETVDAVRAARERSIEVTPDERDRQARILSWQHAQEAERQQRVLSRDEKMAQLNQRLTQRLTVRQ